MITAYFRESESGTMHEVQDVAATALHPFQTGADRLVAPFRDAWGYVTGLIDAKSEADALRKEVQQLRAQSLQARDAIQRERELEALLEFKRSPAFPDDYESISAQVISDPANRFRQQIVIAAGHDHGVRKDYPVVSSAGLVGVVTKVTRRAAEVTLITDPHSSVSSFDPRTESYGVIRGQGEGEPLLLDRVPKPKSVGIGHEVATSGKRYRKLPSLYPRNIAVGQVTSVTHQSTELFKSIQVEPYVDFSSLQAVLVLIPKEPVSELPADDAR
jgi:rod shape-determining protein MreC